MKPRVTRPVEQTQSADKLSKGTSRITVDPSTEVKKESAKAPRQRKASNSPGGAVDSNVTPDQIAERAYAIWQREGCPNGRSTEHWLQAEAELRESRK